MKRSFSSQSFHTRSFLGRLYSIRHDLLILAIFFGSIFLYTHVFATTPNPGHPWDEVGDGTFAVTGPSIARTYTFPDANATVLTSNAAVTLAQGGTSKALTADNGGIIYTDADSMEVLAGTATAGQILRSGASSAPSWSTATYPATVTQGDILYASATNVISSLAKDTNSTRYLSNTGASNAPAWAQVDVSNGVTGQLPLTNGGTAASLTASNGGIFYSTGTAGAILSGTATANQVLLSGASTTPAWSTATYPSTAGTAGNQLVSDGTNFVSADLYQDQYTKAHIQHEASASAVTAYANATSLAYFVYVGRAAFAYSGCRLVVNVTTALSSATYAEVGVFTGSLPGFGSNASLSLRGGSNVATTYNSTGVKSTNISVSGITAGDALWVALGQNATTSYQVRGNLADQFQSGLFQTSTTQISSWSNPSSTTIAGNTVVPPRVALNCS